jgi:Transposase DDE domain group 1
MGSSHTLDQLDTCFDDTHAIANAGLLLPATLAERLGIEQAADALIDLGERAGAHRPGRKLLTLVHAMLAGGDCIDDADLLRFGQTASVLGHRVMAPSTLGTFLRAFTFGHLRQLDRVAETLLTQAWAAGAGPGDAATTIDLDSTVCQVHGYHSRAPPTATPIGSAIIRCWPPGPTPARSCTPGSGPGGPTPPAALPASSTSWPLGCAAPAPAAS